MPDSNRGAHGPPARSGLKSNETKPKAGKDEREAAKPNRGKSKADAPAPPPAVPSANGIQERQNRAELGRARDNKKRWFPQGIKPAEWIMIAFTFVTAMAAWAGVWVAHGQLKEMRASSRDTQNMIAATNGVVFQTKRLADDTASSLKYAQLAANAATDQAKTSADTEHRDLSPFLNLQGNMVAPYPQFLGIDGWGSWQKLHGYFVIQNSGKGEAYNISIVGSVGLLPVNLAALRGASFPEHAIPFSGSLVPSDAQHVDVYGSAMENSDLTSLTSGQKHIYLVGTIRYQDAFGGHRQTQFCIWFKSVDDRGSRCASHNAVN